MPRTTRTTYHYAREDKRHLAELVRFDSADARDAWVAQGADFRGEGFRTELSPGGADRLRFGIDKVHSGLGPRWTSYDAPDGAERYGL